MSKRGILLISATAVAVLLLLIPLRSARLGSEPAASSASVEAPEIPYAGEVPLVPSVRPVLVLKGTDYEMGYQYTRQLIQIFGKHYLQAAAAIKYSEASLATLARSEGYIKKYTPWAVDFVRGMADGCVREGIPMNYRQMLAHAIGTGDAPGGGGGDCSGWAAWGTATKDGKLICGGSGDHEIRVGSKWGLRYETNVVLYPSTGYNYIMSPPSGGSAHPGMNNKGVAYVHHGTSGYYDRYANPEKAKSGEGVPRIFLLMHCLRFSKTAEEAKDIALSIPNPGGRQGGMWADVGGHALVIENRDNPEVVRRPGENGEKDFLYATNNLFSDKLKDCYKPPAGQKVVFFPHVGYLGTEGSLGSIGRNFELWNLFHNYHGKVDVEFAKMVWRFKGPSLPYPTIDEAVADYDKSQARKWNAFVSEPGNSMVGVLQPDNGDEGIFHVSHGCVVRGNDSPTYAGGVVVRLRPTYTFFELKLAANPAKMNAAAKTRARYDLWNANLELAKINYSNAAFAPLNELLNQAVTEWQKGLFYEDQAAELSGDDGVIKWGKAVRCFTRAQAFARQVHDELKPAPKRPEDLGLRAWMGSWADWANRGEN